MGFGGKTALLPRDAVREKMQFALRGNARIELAQAARRRVARVGKGFLAGFFLTAVECGEIGFEH